MHAQEDFRLAKQDFRLVTDERTIPQAACPSAGKERGAAQTLRTRTTSVEADRKSLAVVLCRSQGIPARLVVIACKLEACATCFSDGA
jgi:hypothetical protein